ncbi:hypothetical protein Tco_1553499 [Tanacetum coccineum]
MEYESRVIEDKSRNKGKDYTSNALDALDASSVIIESNGTESKEQDTSSRSGNDAHVDDADIRPIYDEQPMAEERLTRMLNNVMTCPLPVKLYDDKTTELLKSITSSLKMFVLKRLVAQWSHSPLAQQQANSKPQMVQMHISLTNVKANKLLMSVQTRTQRQEMSVENVSSGLVPQGQKASDYDNSGPVPQIQNVV